MLTDGHKLCVVTEITTALWLAAVDLCSLTLLHKECAFPILLPLPGEELRIRNS